MATKHADYIRYQEQIESAVVSVTIKIEDNGVKLIRKGDINMNLHFVEGKDTTTLLHYTSRTHSINSKN